MKVNLKGTLSYVIFYLKGFTKLNVYIGLVWFDGFVLLDC